MSLWVYPENEPFPLQDDEQQIWRENYDRGVYRLRERTCVFCSSPMVVARTERIQSQFDGSVDLHVCHACGWWVTTRVSGFNASYMGTYTVGRACALLRTLDVTDVSLPTSELCRYLVARYEERFRLHPRRYEEVVAGVFADFGYRVRITSYTGDTGIDIVILDGRDNDTVGIQVKRYHNKIEAEQIRAFSGALVLNSLTQGIFVTTSTFRSTAPRVTQEFRGRGLDITLWDANRFYDALKITRCLAYSEGEDTDAPYAHLLTDPKLIPEIHYVGW